MKHLRDATAEELNETFRSATVEAGLIADNARLRAALLVAKTEIDWWVVEHGCCNGHQDEAVATIDAALGHQQDTEGK